MAEQYVEKKHKNKEGVEVVVKYRVDADFKPEKVSDIQEEFIQNYVVANGEVDWLVAQYNETEEAVAKKDSRGKKAGQKYKQQKSFVSIRAAFVAKFFPEIVKGKSSEQTLRTDFMKKYGKQK